MFEGQGHRNGVTHCTLQAACQVQNGIRTPGPCHNPVTAAGGGARPAGRRAAGIARRRPSGYASPMSAPSDATTTVAELREQILAFARARDWEQFHSPKNLSMALAAETGELMEHFLWATPEESKAIAADPARRARIAEELADIVIYALEFANATGLDVAASIESKVAANARKYPVEKARGRSAKYTEL